MPQTLNGNPYLGANSTTAAQAPSFTGTGPNNVTNYSGSTSINPNGLPTYKQVQ
ncbi:MULTISPECIES: hypothetical protein [Helicobacter]|uniref:hypothetical protein n=1 Tax=Helicobacter TaxID=209 RepID=UPI0012E1B6CC|nr:MULTISPECIES: hypothetical protein [Helicobacter]